MTMKSSDLSTNLRELADRVDSADLPPDHEVTIELSFETATTRKQLAKYVAFAGDMITVSTSENNSWLRRYKWVIGHGLFGISVHFTKGLLGGAQRTIVEDDGPAGLAALVAEQSAAAVEQPAEAVA